MIRALDGARRRTLDGRKGMSLAPPINGFEPVSVIASRVMRRLLASLPAETVRRLAATVNDCQLQLALEDELALRMGGHRCPCGSCRSTA